MGRPSTDTRRLLSTQRIGIVEESGTFATLQTAKSRKNGPNSSPITTFLQACPIALFLRIECQRQLPAPVGEKTKLHFCSSISTGLRTSTTHWGTRSATSFCKKSPNVLRCGDGNKTP